MRDTRRVGGDTTTAASPAGPTGDAGSHTPRLVGVAWALLLVNTLGYTSVDLIIPLPRPVAQMITMGALAAAFGLALVLNPRVRVRPSAYLLLLSLLAVASIASSMRLESGLGSLFRCFRLTLFVGRVGVRLSRRGAGFHAPDGDPSMIVGHVVVVRSVRGAP